MAKEHVISFRVSDDQFAALQKRYELDTPYGMGETKSPNRMARKIVLDCINGRTVYVNEDDRAYDLDAIGKSKSVKKSRSGRKK
jgi:hypothetical protein